MLANMTLRGEWIREQRRAAGLTQRQLADSIGALEMSVSRWERNVASPSGEHVWSLVDLFGCDAESE